MHNEPTSSQPPLTPRRSPLRTTEAFIGRMHAARLKHGDCGGQLEVAVLTATTGELRKEIEACTDEAATIERQRDAVALAVQQASSPHSEGGAMITRREATGIRRLLSRLGLTTRYHHRRLSSLT